MTKTFHTQNRQALYARLEDGAAAVVFSGSPPRKSSDEYYPFFADRNFVYLTGVHQKDAQLLGFGGDAPETLFIPPPDAMWERWNGERIKADAAAQASGIADVRHCADFMPALDAAIASGRCASVYLALAKHTADEPDSAEYRLARYIRKRYPHIAIKDLWPHMRALRLIKAPCEIEAMRKAQQITRAGILTMMRTAKPGISELALRAQFICTIMQHGAPTPAAAPIISVGDNNFCIHYDGFGGIAQDGDFVLNDVGVAYDGVVTDVSRGWPVNGRFSERQRLLYDCAYATSNHMFSVIKPGMPMQDVDATIRKVNYGHLRDIGLCKAWDDIGKYMWHGGAHHVGYDVHDPVAAGPATPLAPGMVFCVDVGIYVQDWGIGFRLEDNCLVTEDGCENLSGGIPRSIEEIEGVMRSA